ncbi:MAG TPA: discoidin domain-containing protein [Verrucomicrobiae bacterium]|nr:discoidin domain-containing protein [Verrucomicrobiae bacterium]
MNRKFCFALAIGIVFCLATGTLPAADRISLAGEWRFALDGNGLGVKEQWFDQNLPKRILLPGILQAQGYGDKISIHTPWVLTLYDRFWYLRADYAADTNAGQVKVPFLCQPPRHYLGPAWYQRDIEIPPGWDRKRVVLFLERPHWKTTVWLDDREIGSDTSLCTPHEYDFGVVPPGRHRLTICVDNRMILPYRPDAHSVSDSLDAAWNGIVGKIELRATPLVWIDDVQIFPNAEKKVARIRIRIGNASGQSGYGTIRVWRGARTSAFPDVAARVQWDASPGSPEPKLPLPPADSSKAPVQPHGNVELQLPLGDNAPVWSEFNPALQHIHIEFKSDSIDEVRDLAFGLRDFRADGNQFILNGRPIYFRGTHFGGDFPLTGYPPTDIESWKKLFLTCKEYGLNHMRFHSWCPPEAAFDAADELGFYLQVEPGMWNEFSPGGEMEKVLYAETGRILKAYGNHPSLMLISASNEAHGNWKPVLARWVEHFRTEDPRHLYTPDTGWSLIDSPGPVTGADYLDVARIGRNSVRGDSGWFGRDFSNAVAGVNVPVVAHEVGQWCAYPNYDIIKKFTGYMRPGNYEIFRDSLAAHGMPEMDQDFAWASGRFQLECYQEEIEANLRTPGLDGFQLLDLHDYVGQGTALVGVLDTFWDSKGYATPAEFREFCNPVVPLARLTRRVFTTADPFQVPVEIANFGQVLSNAPVVWEIINSSNRIVTNGSLGSPTIPIGKNFALGEISADLSPLAAPAAYKLVVEIQNPPFANHWNFWLYPAHVSESIPPDVLVTGSWDAAVTRLAAGGKVLFLPRPADLSWTSPPLAAVPVFWNRLMDPEWGRMLGLWCETNHPALAEFPTEPNCDWQWTQILRGVRGINLDHLPRGLHPIVQAIDDWNRNWKLGVVFDCQVGPGKLMFCTVDLEHDLDQRPVARQLRRSLLDYMARNQFRPKTTISPGEFCYLHFDSRIMQKLGATARADGINAEAAIDGNPNTCWSVGQGRGQRPVPFPHELTVTFPSPVPMNGLTLMSRQNDRDHLGDTRAFQIEVADGDQRWQKIASGELASTWNPQTIHFVKTVTATRLRFIALSDFGDDHSTALAELAVLYAGPKLAGMDPGETYPP